MDALDRKILGALQRDALLTADELSGIVGLSPSACLRRLKRLRESGIVAGNISVLAPEAVGRGLMMIVQVSLERERADIIGAFKKAMLAHDSVMQCYYVAGLSDFVLIMTAKDMEDYDNFTQKYLIENKEVRRFDTQIVIDRVKYGLSVPV